MNLMRKIQTYGDAHHPKWLDVLRMLLGLILIAKGVYYIQNTKDLSDRLGDVNFGLENMVIVHYVAFAHLLGGILIATGLVTRIAILFQIPVLLGAVIFSNAKAGLLSPDSEVLLPLIVLFLLIFFLIYGSGPWSIDAMLEKNRETWDSDHNM